jgi:NADH-quinone oxidoreductase subunit L
VVTLITLIPLLPLAGFLAAGLGFRSMPKRVTTLVACGSVGLSFVLSIIVFFRLLQDPAPVTVTLFNWISFGTFHIPFAFLVDPLSVLMLLVVTGVGFVIHIYSAGYMAHDPGYNRFFAFMNLFVFSMLILVLGSSFAVMFIGWEGVGLCSYLLIGFWFKNTEYNNAAKKAFIMNRIGDLGFLLGMFLIVTKFGSLVFAEVFPKAMMIEPGGLGITAITLLLFVGAVGKSAQIPLYTWLPDAMAGPTPVSALIHAATMVTAGVYMVARSGVLYALAPVSMTVIGITGLATALFAATIAIFQTDIKKVLAYSTISQLGYMFLALGVGSFTGAMFHLTTHAFFKALLFLAAGSVIHAMGGEQDIRKMGGLRKSLPVTWWTFLAGTIAIAGLPPLSGFFSKDEILDAVFRHNIILWIFAVTGALMTAYYMFRLLFLTFTGSFRGSKETYDHLHESPSVMTVPLIILAVLALFGGFLNLPELFGGSRQLEHFLSPVFADAGKILVNHRYDVSTQETWFVILVPLIWIALMILASYGRFIRMGKVLDDEEIEHSFFIKLAHRKFYIDEIYDFLFVRPVMWCSKMFHDILEIRVVDRAVNGIGFLVVRTGSVLRYVQTGHVGFYMFIMILAVLAILIFNILL